MLRWRCQNEVGTRGNPEQCPNEWDRGVEQRGFALYDQQQQRIKMVVVCDACCVKLAESLVNYVTEMMVSGVKYREERRGEQLELAFGS